MPQFSVYYLSVRGVTRISKEDYDDAAKIFMQLHPRKFIDQFDIW